MTLTREDVAARILHCRPDQVTRLLRRRDDPLPAMKAGKRWLFDEQEVLKWAKRQAEKVLRPRRKGA